MSTIAYLKPPGSKTLLSYTGVIPFDLLQKMSVDDLQVLRSTGKVTFTTKSKIQVNKKMTIQKNFQITVLSNDTLIIDDCIEAAEKRQAKTEQKA